MAFARRSRGVRAALCSRRSEAFKRHSEAFAGVRGGVGGVRSGFPHILLQNRPRMHSGSVRVAPDKVSRVPHAPARNKCSGCSSGLLESLVGMPYKVTIFRMGPNPS